MTCLVSMCGSPRRFIHVLGTLQKGRACFFVRISTGISSGVFVSGLPVSLLPCIVFASGHCCVR